MVNVTLYVYAGDNRVLGKVATVSAVNQRTATGTFRLPMDTLYPVLVVEVDKSGTAQQQTMWRNVFNKCNYIYIAELNRYYYVDSVTVINNDLREFHLKVDVLQSYEADIRALTCFVERNENLYDNALEDSTIPLRAVKTVNEYDIDTGDVEFKTENLTHNTTISVIDTHNIYYNSQYQTDTHYYYPNYDKPETFIGSDIDHKLFVAMQSSKILVFPDWETMYKTLYTIVKSYDSRISFIKSITAFPFEVPHNSIPANISATEKDDRFRLFLGDEGINSIGTLEPNGQAVDIYLPTSKYRFSDPLVIARFGFSNDSGTFIDKAPYRRVELFLPYYGWIELNTQEIYRDCTYEVAYTVDYESGKAQVFVYRKKRTQPSVQPTILFTNTCQLGTVISLDKTNFEENEAKRNAISQQTAISLISSAISVGVGVATSNPIGVVAGVMGGANAVTSAMAQSAQIFDKAQGNFGSPVSGLYSFQKVRVKITSMSQTVLLNSTSFAKEFGKPLKQMASLNTLTGMTVCGNPVLDSVKALDSEKREISDLMQRGIIL